MLALVGAVEAFIAFHAHDFRHVWGWDWHLTAQAIEREAPRCDVLCLGDSLVKFGIAPRVLEQRLGVRAYNLALSAASPPAIYFVLRRALECGARPRAVLVDIAPHGISGDLQGNQIIWPELLDVRDALDLAWTTRDGSLFGGPMLGRLLPSVRGRAMIREHVLHALRGEPYPMRRATRLYIRGTQANRGASLVPENEPYHNNLPQFAGQLVPGSWLPRRLNVHYIRRFLDLAARHRIAVYWIIPPFAAEVHAQRARLGRDAEYTQFLVALQARYPNLVVIDARSSGYDTGTHFDPLHLNRRGALTLTTDVAEAIAQRNTPANHWISLPRFRELAPDEPAGGELPSRLALRPGRARAN